MDYTAPLFMAATVEEKELIRAQKYDPFRLLLDRAELVLGHDPGLWWFSLMRFLLRSRSELSGSGDQYPSEVVSFAQKYGDLFIGILKGEMNQSRKSSEGDNENDHCQVSLPDKAVQVMHMMSEALMKDERLDHELREIRHISLEELCNMSPRFKMTVRESTDGTQRNYFCIYSEKRQSWYEYPVPDTDKVLHKGGLGRTILKIISGADPETIEAELPPNDYDYLVVKDTEGIQGAIALGADPDGIETVNSFDFQELMDNRDLDMNNAFVGRHGIYFSDDSYEACRTGKISIVSTKRGIYGSEVFYYEGIRVLKNRGIMRLLKTLAEGKALAFDFLPLNCQVNMGIYWLVLAKRFSHKENFALIFDRLFELARQIGQLPDGASSIYDILDAAHEKYPFYDFDGKQLDDLGVARWLGRKFVKQVDKKYRETSDIPSLLTLVRQPDDTTPYEVNLQNYQPDQIRLAEIKSGWSAFLTRCRRRTTAYLEGEQSDSYENGDSE